MDGSSGEASLTSREVPLEGLPQLAQGAGEGAGDRALVDVKDGRNFLVAEAFGAKLEDLELTGGGDAGEPAADLVAALGGVEVRRFGCGGGVTDFVFGPGADLGLGARAGDVAAHGTVEPFAGLGDGDALAPESEQVQEGLLDGFLGLAAVGRTDGGEAQQAGFEITTLDRVWQSRKPTQSVEIAERTSWGDYPGLTQWATGVVENGKDTTWKGALRRALDNATSDLDKVYEDALRPYSIDPWRLRDDYLPALLKGHTPDEFLSERIPSISAKAADVVKVSLQAQRLIQRMYNSYTFTDNVLDGRQPRYAIACAAAALSMVQDVSGLDLNDRLPLDLAVVTSPGTSLSGADMLRDALREFDLSLLGS